MDKIIVSGIIQFINLCYIVLGEAGLFLQVYFLVQKNSIWAEHITYHFLISEQVIKPFIELL